MRPERADFRSEKAYLCSERADLRPEGVYLMLEKVNLRPNRPDSSLRGPRA